VQESRGELPRPTPDAELQIELTPVGKSAAPEAL
jgi:hypothetical protein